MHHLLTPGEYCSEQDCLTVRCYLHLPALVQLLYFQLAIACDTDTISRGEFPPMENLQTFTALTSCILKVQQSHENVMCVRKHTDTKTPVIIICCHVLDLTVLLSVRFILIIAFW